MGSIVIDLTTMSIGYPYYFILNFFFAHGAKFLIQLFFAFYINSLRYKRIPHIDTFFYTFLLLISTCCTITDIYRQKYFSIRRHFNAISLLKCLIYYCAKHQFSGRLSKILTEVFIEYRKQMGNSDKLNGKKLQRIITLRMTCEDYDTLLAISKNKHSNVSRTIRSIVQVVLDMVRENNAEDNK